MTETNFQAITVAIGKLGIEFFVENLIAGQAIALFQDLTPPDKTITVPDWNVSMSHATIFYSKYVLTLSEGSLAEFTPQYQSVEQGGESAGNEFKLKLDAEDFDAHYNWHESYHENVRPVGGHGTSENVEDDFPYSSDYGKLDVVMTLQFTYSPDESAYFVEVSEVTTTPDNVTCHTPEDSVLNVQGDCQSDNVSDATNEAIEAIDFGPVIEELVNGTLSTIPDSGTMGNGISFEFGLGAGGLSFNGGNGIQIAVTGVASYNGEAYPGANKPTLPIPAVPDESSGDHINIYVSDWAINGLYWASFKAGLLDKRLKPSDIPFADYLKTENYPTLNEEYGKQIMIAHISPCSAPIVTFKEVYSFTTEVMDAIKNDTRLSDDDKNHVRGFSGDTYVDEADLSDDLSKNNISDEGCQIIIEIAKQNGLVTTQNIEFNLEIELVEDAQETNPNIIWELERTDVITNLSLGFSEESGEPSNVQSLKFVYDNASNEVTFKSATAEGFEVNEFEGIWDHVGEAKYEECMAEMGKRGVALPMTEGFEFMFGGARLNLEKGYVAISSQVAFRPESLSGHVAKLWVPLSKTNQAD